MTKVNYVVAIPSYKRPETLRDKTLQILKQYHIDPKKIDIFVANKEEEKIYKETLDPKSYNKIIVGVINLGPQRNFISNYYPEGKHIVNIDDDIQGFIEYTTINKRHEKPLANLEKIIQEGFNECKVNGFRLWGVYPIPNGYFMEKKVDTDLRYIIGCFYGIINTKKIKLELKNDKEDYERSIRYYIADGGVIRLRHVAPKTAYYTEKGGIQEFRSESTVMAGAKWIVKEFPEYATLNLTKKSGYAEVRLRDRTKKMSEGIRTKKMSERKKSVKHKMSEGKKSVKHKTLKKKK